MKLTVNLPKCSIEMEAEKATDLFKQFAQVYEVFGEDKCYECGCEQIVPNLRQPTSENGKTTYDYFEWVCKSPKCRARLSLGQQEGGTLFPKRRLARNGAPCKAGEEGEYRNNGWTKFRGHDNDQEQPANKPGRK